MIRDHSRTVEQARTDLEDGTPTEPLNAHFNKSQKNVSYPQNESRAAFTLANTSAAKIDCSSAFSHVQLNRSRWNEQPIVLPNSDGSWSMFSDITGSFGMANTDLRTENTERC